MKPNKGTDMEGLDVFQRQLKRFDIKRTRTENGSNTDKQKGKNEEESEDHKQKVKKNEEGSEEHKQEVKKGDTVWSTWDDLGRLHACEVVSVYFGRKAHENYIELNPIDYCGRRYGAAFGAIGKTVFLTRAEAEAALKGV